jgi:hypothetical protein
MQLGDGPGSVVKNVRFADDIILIGRTLPQIKQMIADVSTECARVGLELYPEKTTIQHNNIGYGSQVRSAKVGGMTIDVLDTSASTMYLGRLLSLTDPHEVDHRVRKAWAKFGVFWEELTDQAVNLHLRLKLFHSILTPTILYGCSSWVMTAAREEKLKVAQLKMMRTILGRARKRNESTSELETWVEWVQRVTTEARRVMADHNIPHWVDEQAARMRHWNAQVKTMESERWAKHILGWQPEGYRSRGHPRARWADRVELLCR